MRPPPRPPPPKPPPDRPPPRGLFSWASLTLMVLPSRLVPSILDIAVFASSSFVKVTNPNPRERPVSRSVITLASVISPKDANAWRRPSSVVSQLSPPTNNFFAILFTAPFLRRLERRLLMGSTRHSAFATFTHFLNARIVWRNGLAILRLPSGSAGSLGNKGKVLAQDSLSTDDFNLWLQ